MKSEKFKQELDNIIQKEYKELYDALKPTSVKVLSIKYEDN